MEPHKFNSKPLTEKHYTGVTPYYSLYIYKYMHLKKSEMTVYMLMNIILNCTLKRFLVCFFVQPTPLTVQCPSQLLRSTHSVWTPSLPNQEGYPTLAS
jgi:hypothetical protein